MDKIIINQTLLKKLRGCCRSSLPIILILVVATLLIQGCASPGIFNTETIQPAPVWCVKDTCTFEALAHKCKFIGGTVFSDKASAASALPLFLRHEGVKCPPVCLWVSPDEKTFGDFEQQRKQLNEFLTKDQWFGLCHIIKN